MKVDAMEALIGQMRTLAAEASSKSSATGAAGPAPDFASALKAAIDGVNQSQHQASVMEQQFSAGTGNMSLSDVMLAAQKANLSFQTMLQVRNKLVSAYQDIMNLQV